MFKHFLVFSFLLTVSTAVFAQKPRFGIKTGLNVSSMIGGYEQNAAGKTLDRYDPKTGFQVGLTAALPLNDVFGVGAELLYAQRGSVYTYENGRSFFALTPRTGSNSIVTTGDLTMKLNTSLSYIEVPLLVYVKPIKQLKVELGVSPMFLMAATGRGEFFLQNRGYVNNQGVETRLQDAADMSVRLDYDYIKDQPGDFGLVPNSNGVVVSTQTIVTQIEGDDYTYPYSAGAHYFDKEKPYGQNLYNFFDLGANLGVAYTFSSGLSFNLRGSYGLLDATNNQYERKWSPNTTAPSFQVTQLNRDARNFNVALTIGFSF
jgi:Outer membrane protein beta-barrel domain